MAQLTKLYPDVAATAKRLRDGGLRLGIVSTKFRYRIEHILEIHGLSSEFEIIVGAEDVERVKPEPDALILACERLKVARSEAIYVGPAYTCQATITVLAKEAETGTEVEGRAEVYVLEKLLGKELVSGIPEPHPVHAPLASWRSRHRNGSWEYNTGHRDYLAASASEARRLRYLIHLFAKEIVLRNFGQPADEPTLERMEHTLMTGKPLRN